MRTIASPILTRSRNDTVSARYAQVVAGLVARMPLHMTTLASVGDSFTPRTPGRRGAR
jgi:hypothetical protein